MNENHSLALAGASLLVFCLACSGAMPDPSDPVRQTIDVIEHNTVYSGCGKETLRQWVFHDRGQIRTWRLVKDEKVWRDFERGGYVMLWFDGEVFRELRALSYEETHLQYDPEIHAREHELSKERRIGLLFERGAK